MQNIIASNVRVACYSYTAERNEMIKGLVFDMDGLLFDTERIVQRSWNRSSVELGYPPAGEEIYHTLGFNRARRAVYFKNLYGEDFPHQRFQDNASRYFVEIIEEEGLPVKEGVYELLDFAKEQNLRLGIATSSSEAYAKANLAEAGILEYFDGFVFGNMVTNSKPDPEIYTRACQAIDVRPSEAVAFEDAPAGVRSAYAAGLRPVMIPDLVEPDAEILQKTWQVRSSLLAVIPLLAAELDKG